MPGGFSSGLVVAGLMLVASSISPLEKVTPGSASGGAAVDAPCREAASRGALVVSRSSDDRHVGAEVTLIAGLPASPGTWGRILDSAAQRYEVPDPPSPVRIMIEGHGPVTVLFGTSYYAREIWLDGPEGPFMVLHRRFQHSPNLDLVLVPRPEAACSSR